MKATLKKSDAAEPFTFRFDNDAGKMVVRSENYAQKPSAKNGIESVKKNSQDDARYEVKESTSGKYMFNLKASNGQVVATSALYDSESDRAAAMADLKANAASAEVVEDV